MANFAVKGDDDQWKEALMSRKTGTPQEVGIVQIKLNGNIVNSKRKPEKRDADDEAANKKKRKGGNMKHEKKPREKR